MPGVRTSPEDTVRAEAFIAIVDEIPLCDFCKDHGVNKKAGYIGRTKRGRWAYMCQTHFRKHGVGMGVGKGQLLKKREAVSNQLKLKREKVEICLSCKQLVNCDDIGKFEECSRFEEITS